MKLFLPSTVALLLGCAGTATTADDHPDRAAQVAEARRLLDAGEVDDALVLTDTVLKAESRNREARLIAAHGSHQLFSSGRSGGQFLLADAIRHLEMALDVDRKDGESWLKLANWRLQNSEFEAGAEAAGRALEEFIAAKAPKERRAAALMALARNQMQAFADLRRAEREEDPEARPEDETMVMANAILATSKSAWELGSVGPAALMSARVCQWLGRPKQALDFLERGIGDDPGAGDLHNSFRDIYFSTGSALSCVGAYRRMLRRHGDNPILVWYMGRAQVAAADNLRAKSNVDGATEQYEAALTSFSTSRQLRPAIAASCDAWSAICEMSLGRMAYEAGDLEAASNHYDNAYHNTPRIAEYDAAGRPALYDGMSKHYLGNIQLLGAALLESDDGHAAALRYYDRLVERHPGQYSFLYNNAALTARDLGEKIAAPDEGVSADERALRLEEAMALWEKSYRYYEEAVKLAPDDARIVNDCGLMLVYYLRRDYDRAKELFDHAIEVGQAQLDELPDDTPRAERHNLEEAVGDAYQNTGVMLEQSGRPATETRPLYEKAVKYFPYEKREAAMKLATSGTRNAAFPQDPQDPRKKEFDAKIAEASAKADEQDFDSALLVMDQMAKTMKGYAPFHYHFGLYSLRYAQSQAQAGGNAGLISGLFADAVSQLEKAVEIDKKSVDPQLRLGEAYIATGDYEKAKTTTENLFKNAAKGALSGDSLVTANATLGVAASRTYIAAKSANKDDAASLDAARKAFANVEKSRVLTASERSTWVNAERWAGASDRAIGVVTRALKANSADEALLGELVELGRQVGENESVVKALGSRRDALGVWFRGKAHFNLAQAQWSGGTPKKAIATLDDGVKAFDKSKSLNAGYAGSCDQWAAICLGSRGLVQISADDVDGARDSFIAALERNPATLTTDLGSGNIKRGILIVGDKYFRAGELGKTADFYMAVGKLAHSDVDLANNEGLFARDHGVAVSRSGSKEKAKPYFEASYAAYTRASQLDPGNVRLRNDRALLLIYHLHRELDTARECLDSAIADGLAQLENSPPEGETELQNLQEAVGDCYENLALYYIDHNRDLDKAKAAANRSLEFYPFQSRGGARRHLRRIEELREDR